MRLDFYELAAGVVLKVGLEFGRIGGLRARVGAEGKVGKCLLLR